MLGKINGDRGEHRHNTDSISLEIVCFTNSVIMFERLFLLSMSKKMLICCLFLLIGSAIRNSEALLRN